MVHDGHEVFFATGSPPVPRTPHPHTYWNMYTHCKYCQTSTLVEWELHIVISLLTLWYWNDCVQAEFTVAVIGGYWWMCRKAPLPPRARLAVNCLLGVSVLQVLPPWSPQCALPDHHSVPPWSPQCPSLITAVYPSWSPQGHSLITAVYPPWSPQGHSLITAVYPLWSPQGPSLISAVCPPWSPQFPSLMTIVCPPWYHSVLP